MSELSLRFIFYGLVFVATLLAIEGGFLYLRDHRGVRRKINSRLDLIARGYDRTEVMAKLRRDGSNAAGFGPLAPFARRLEQKLAQAGMRISVQRFILGMAVATAAVMLLGFALNATLLPGLTAGATLLLFVVAISLGVGAPWMFISLNRERRLKKLEAQFPVALDVFVRGLRAGHPVASALDLLTSEMPDPIGSEFGLVVDEITYGLDLRDALQNMADRLELQDLHMFVVSVSIQNETGGNLAEILENLAKVIRERASMVLKVRALSSEGKMSGWMLTALPVFTFLSVFLSSPQFYLDVAADPIFMPAAVGLLTMYALGVWMIRRLIDLKI